MSEPLHYESRMDPTEPPASLRAVAWLFIAFGTLAAIDVITDLRHGRISINLGVLGIFIGRGLLRRSRGWRTCALVFVWIGLIGIPLLTLGAMFGGANVNIAGQSIAGSGVRAVALVICAGLFALELWQYRVLTRPDVRRLFGVHKPLG